MNVTKKMRILCLLLSLLLLLAACGSDGGSSSSNSTADEGGDGGSADEVVDYVNPAGEFPIVNEEITLRFIVPQDTNIENYDTNYYTNWLEEKSGINLEFDVIPSADMAQKVQLQLASFTDLPDAIIGVGRVGSPIFNTTNIVKYGSEGQLIPLNDLIDTYGENTKALFAKYADDKLEQIMTSADGNIYYMPGYGPAIVNRSSAVYWINKGWLDNLGLEAPSTTEELYDVLNAFKTQDPNGNGKADEIPLVGTTENFNASYSGYDYLLGSFLVNNTQNHRLTYDENGQLQYAPISDEWREAMIYLNRLTTEGLFSPLTFTQDQTSLKQIVNDSNDICGGFVALGIGLVAQPNDQEILSRYVAVEPLEGPNGVQTSVLIIPTASANAVITSACEYPEAAFRLFDLMLGEEASTISRYGEKGVHWDDPDEGQLSRYDTPATMKILDSIWMTMQNTHWMNYCPFVNDIHNDGSAKVSDEDPETVNAVSSLKYMEYEPTNTVPVLIYQLDEVETISEITTNLTEYMYETIAKFAVGEMDPNDDATWERYLAEFEVIGLPTFMDLSQAAFERME